MPTIEALTKQLKNYLNDGQINLVSRAYYYADQAHDGQRRRSGEPYVTHPLSVAFILAEMHMDHESLMAAMLHDVIEDTSIEKPAIAEQFGLSVASIVDGVSKLTSMHFEDRAVQQAENFQKMALAMAEDIRVILVKLADRLHNMRTLGSLRPDKRRRIAKETLEIYAPIANRLGMHNMRVEFEDLGFSAMFPMRVGLIKAAVQKARGHRRELVTQVEEAVRKRLEEEGLEADVSGREKHLYSIYRKMRAQKKSFSEIMDVFGFRIVVNSVDDCYRALGKVHNLFKPIPGRFKDYIAIPKANGYQSLHTTLFGLHGIPVEIQIRTRAMDEMASNGIAGHWLYKDGDPNGSEARTRHWLRGLLEMQQQAGNSLEFIENVKIDLFPDEVYVFTPQGDIMELPKGATPVDFAYAVHTDVGNTCVACKINRRLASLSQPLQSGQTVEVVTAPGASPNAAWLSFVTTGKARANIRHYLKNQKHTESIALGRRLLNRALGASGSSLDQLSDDQILPVLQQANLTRFEDLLEDIGLGNRMAYIIARRLLASSTESQPEQLNQNQSKALSIKGTEGMVIGFAKCCHPIPGDPVVAHISSGKGIVVHTELCPNIADIRHNPEKIMEVQWDKQVSGEFSVELKVELEHQRGSIAALATTITDAEASIEKINIQERDERFSLAELLISVKDRVHLAHVIKRLRTITEVTGISRSKS